MPTKATLLRYGCVALIILLTALVLVFAFGNTQNVTLSFLSARLTLPLSLMVLLVYALGVVTGGTVMSFLRTVVRGAKARPTGR